MNAKVIKTPAEMLSWAACLHSVSCRRVDPTTIERIQSLEYYDGARGVLTVADDRLIFESRVGNSTLRSVIPCETGGIHPDLAERYVVSWDALRDAAINGRGGMHAGDITLRVRGEVLDWHPKNDWTGREPNEIVDDDLGEIDGIDRPSQLLIHQRQVIQKNAAPQIRVPEGTSLDLDGPSLLQASQLGGDGELYFDPQTGALATDTSDEGVYVEVRSGTVQEDRGETAMGVADRPFTLPKDYGTVAGLAQYRTEGMASDAQRKRSAAFQRALASGMLHVAAHVEPEIRSNSLRDTVRLYLHRTTRDNRSRKEPSKNFLQFGQRGLTPDRALQITQELEVAMRQAGAPDEGDPDGFDNPLDDSSSRVLRLAEGFENPDAILEQLDPDAVQSLGRQLALGAWFDHETVSSAQPKEDWIVDRGVGEIASSPELLRVTQDMLLDEVRKVLATGPGGETEVDVEDTLSYQWPALTGGSALRGWAKHLARFMENCGEVDRHPELLVGYLDQILRRLHEDVSRLESGPAMLLQEAVPEDIDLLTAETIERPRDLLEASARVTGDTAPGRISESKALEYVPLTKEAFDISKLRENLSRGAREAAIGRFGLSKSNRVVMGAGSPDGLWGVEVIGTSRHATPDACLSRMGLTKEDLVEMVSDPDDVQIGFEVEPRDLALLVNRSVGLRSLSREEDYLLMVARWRPEDETGPDSGMPMHSVRQSDEGLPLIGQNARGDFVDPVITEEEGDHLDILVSGSNGDRRFRLPCKNLQVDATDQEDLFSVMDSPNEEKPEQSHRTVSAVIDGRRLNRMLSGVLNGPRAVRMEFLEDGGLQVRWEGRSVVRIPEVGRRRIPVDLRDYIEFLQDPDIAKEMDLVEVVPPTGRDPERIGSDIPENWTPSI